MLNYGVKMIDGVDFQGEKLLYGYQPILDLILFSNNQDGKTIREQGYGLATMANIWVGLFPLTIFIVYSFCTASVDSFVNLSESLNTTMQNRSGHDLYNSKDIAQQKKVEMKNLISNDSLAVIEDEPDEPQRQVEVRKKAVKKQKNSKMA